MKESLIYDNKKFLMYLKIFEGTILATEVKKLLKVLATETGSLMYFSSLVIHEGVSLFFCFTDTKVFIDVFIKEVCEILFFSPFDKCR